MPKFNPDLSSSEYKQLRDWLSERNARNMWIGHAELGPTTLGYVVNGVLVIVVLYRPIHDKRGGWDIYIPSDPNSNDIAATLAAVEKAVGLS